MVSRTTVDQIVAILIEEVGYNKAKKLVTRFDREVKGNKSFRDTVCALLQELRL